MVERASPGGAFYKLRERLALILLGLLRVNISRRAPDPDDRPLTVERVEEIVNHAIRYREMQGMRSSPPHDWRQRLVATAMRRRGGDEVIDCIATHIRNWQREHG